MCPYFNVLLEGYIILHINRTGIKHTIRHSKIFSFDFKVSVGKPFVSGIVILIFYKSIWGIHIFLDSEKYIFSQRL
jgi:hypothetical protein